MSNAHITPNAASKRAMVKATATNFSSFLTCQTNTLVYFLWLALRILSSYNGVRGRLSEKHILEMLFYETQKTLLH